MGVKPSIIIEDDLLKLQGENGCLLESARVIKFVQQEVVRLLSRYDILVLLDMLEVFLLATAYDYRFVYHVVANEVLVVELDKDLVLLAFTVVMYPTVDFVLVWIWNEAGHIVEVVQGEKHFGIESMYIFLMICCWRNPAPIHPVL